MNKTYGITLLLFSSLMFGSYGVWSKLIGASMSPFFQGWSRGLVISLILLPVLYYLRLIVPIKREDWKWLAVFAVFTSATQAPLFYAFTHMDIGSATLLFFTSMLLTMYAVGFLFLGEGVTDVKITSFVIACAGMYMVFSFSLAAFSIFAALMAVLNGVASGGEVSFSKRLLPYSALYLSWISWTAIFLVNAPISLFLHEAQVPLALSSPWFWQLCYTIASLLGFWAVIEGLKYLEAGVGGLLGLLEIIFSIGFGIILFGEKLTSQVAIGAILILTAAALPHIRELYTKPA